MRVLLSTLSLLCFLVSCKCNKVASKEDTVMVVTKGSLVTETNMPNVIYLETSRGFYKKIAIDGVRIYVTTVREAKPVFWDLKKSDYQKLSDLYQSIDLQRLSNLKAPTDKRLVDGATIATLAFVKDSTTYTSSEFDGGTPPKEIEVFVNELISIAKNLNK